MKILRTLSMTLLLSLPLAVAAQDEVVDTAAIAQDAPAGVWSTLTKPALKFSEFLIDNWSKSGNSQIDVTATFFGNYKYTHPHFVWDNVADLSYGYAWQDLDNSAKGGLFETRRKSNDKIDLTSALSWKAYKDWGASFTANLKTQFGKGFEYAGIEDHDGTLVSNFMAPGYLTTALSFEYKKPDWSVSLSFLTGKTTFVFNNDLIDSGYTYGVIQDDNFYLDDGTLNPGRKYTHVHFALGSYIRAQYLKENLLPNLDLYARLEIFYAYEKNSVMAWNSDPTVMEAKSKYTLSNDETWSDLSKYNWLQRRIFETDFDFELKLDYRFTSHIAANFALNLKWDTDFSGMGRWGHLQVYQMLGVQVFFAWETPRGEK